MLVKRNISPLKFDLENVEEELGFHIETTA